MVPNGWLVKSLNDITNWSSGGTPPKSNPDFWNGDVPWISAASMRGHYFGDSEVRITEQAVSNGAKMAPQNSLLLLVRGSMLWNKIPVGITTRKVSFNQDVKCLKPDIKKTNSEFLLYWFLNNEHRLMNMVTGTGIGAGKLDTTDLQNLDVFLPPLLEQQKIAKILSTWDKAIATTEKLIATSQQQKKALMQQLLTGKKRLISPETGKVFEEEWEEVEQGDIATFFNGRAYKQTEWEENGTPVIRLQNLTGRGSEFYYSTLELPDHQYCNTGDLLYMWSATFGPAIWHGEKAIYHYHIWKVECNANRLNKLFMYFLLHFETQKWMSQSNGMGLLHITKTTMEKQKILLPNMKEQQKIASVITSVDKEIELLKAKLAYLKDEKKALMQQLLTGKRRVNVEHMEKASC